jgi:release factor glutamine methyltransferase
MTARAAIADAARHFAEFSDTARLDAELLMAHAMGVSREALLLGRLDDRAPERFAGLVARRREHEPVAYIVGRRDFWTIDIDVGPGVLVPRADSETLIEAAVAHFAGRAPAAILDLGTGPGTLLFAALAEWPDARGLGVDASEAALGYARGNAERLGLAARAELRRGDWAAGIAGRFDLILCNPPYIGTGEVLPREVAEHEPGEALFAGADGLDDYRRILPEIPELLAPGGTAILEIGAEQGGAVTALAEATGLSVTLHRDMGGRPRAVRLA